jgi:hypothetical protein
VIRPPINGGQGPPAKLRKTGTPKQMSRSALQIKPKPRQTAAEFKQLQKLAASVIMRPLNAQWRTQREWIDGQSTEKFAADFIKPNDRLSSLERIEIYNRQYWFRLIDSLYDDFPGLHAVMGQNRFSKFVRAYLAEYPSRSFTLRNLGSRLPQMLRDHPEWAGPRAEMAQDMAAFEWAQVIAFDSESRAPLGVDDFLGADPRKMRLGLQPYLTLLDLRYPLDEFSLALKRRINRSTASNSAAENQNQRKVSRVRLPKPQRVFVAVHRLDNSIYYKRLDAPAYALLDALRQGKTLARAVAAASDVEPTTLQQWFKQWAAMGWFCRFKPAKKTA